MEEISEASVEKVLADEELTHFSWFEDRWPRANEVGIQRVGVVWRVYSTDERANPLLDKTFDDEAAALAEFLLRLRATNRYFRSETT